MIKELQELGVETMVSIWPAVDFRSENYEEMKQQNMLVKSNSGVDVQMIFHAIMPLWTQLIQNSPLCLGKMQTKLRGPRHSHILAGRCRAGVYVLRF